MALRSRVVSPRRPRSRRLHLARRVPGPGRRRRPRRSLHRSRREPGRPHLRGRVARRSARCSERSTGQEWLPQSRRAARADDDEAPADLFASLDIDRDGRVAPSEWHWSRASFDRRDRTATASSRATSSRRRARRRRARKRRAAYRAGYERGLLDGRKAGREDRAHNHWDLDGQRELEQADAGYTPRGRPALGVSGRLSRGVHARLPGRLRPALKPRSPLVMWGRPSGLLASAICRAEALPHVTDACAATMSASTSVRCTSGGYGTARRWRSSSISTRRRCWPPWNRPQRGIDRRLPSRR